MKECIKRRHPKTKKKRKKMEKVCGPMTKKYSTVTKMSRRDDARYEEDGGAPPTSSSPTSSHYGKTKCSHTSLSSLQCLSSLSPSLSRRMIFIYKEAYFVLIRLIS